MNQQTSFVYILYFDRVDIVSRYEKGQRRVLFSPDFKGQSAEEERPVDAPTGTTLHFGSFSRGRLRSYDDVRPSILKTQIMEHFLPMLLDRRRKGEPFLIEIELETPGGEQRHLFPDSQRITTDDVPDFKRRTLRDPTIDAHDAIDVLYVVREEPGPGKFNSAISIDGRTIPFRLLDSSRIPDGYSVVIFFESPLFAGRSDSSRQRLTLPDTLPESVLRKRLLDEVADVLGEELPEIEARNQEVQEEFEAQYPHLQGLFATQTVGLVDRNDAIHAAQLKFFVKQREVLEATTLDEATFRRSLELSARTLTEYILYRETIIRKLSEMTGENREDEIHNLIVPRYKTYEHTGLIEDVYRNNAWILDDRFMSYRTLLSEKRMSDLIAAVTLDSEEVEDDKRPDISVIFSADPDEVEAVNVVVVELKRRFESQKENINAVAQLASRAQQLVRHCPNIQQMWYFAVVDISFEFAEILTTLNWIPMFSGGRMFYQELSARRDDGVVVPAPTHVLSYDAVIQDAAARNHTFLEILRRDIREAVLANSDESAP